MKVLKTERLTWSELENKAKDRNDCKAVLYGLCPGGGAVSID